MGRNPPSAPGWKRGFVQYGEAGTDAAGQQCLVVHLAVRGRGEDPHGFQQIALSASVGADENVDPSKVNLDVLKGFEGSDGQMFKHSAQPPAPADYLNRGPCRASSGTPRGVSVRGTGRRRRTPGRVPSSSLPCVMRGRHASAGGGPARPPARNGSPGPDWAWLEPGSPGAGFSVQGPLRCRYGQESSGLFRMQATALSTQSESIWRGCGISVLYVGRSFQIKADSSALTFFSTDSLSFWPKENTMSLDLRIRHLKSTNEGLLSQLHCALSLHSFSLQFFLHHSIRKLPPVSRCP